MQLPAILPMFPLSAAAAVALLAGPALTADLARPPDVAALRAGGPAALDALLARYDRADPDDRDALAADVDAVAGQRYATVSRLYWFTELDRAETEARRLHRPILALRMLGDLRDDLSCANSRLFRATLYANAEVSAFLRANFVLYWSSERAVPIVTIDYGDGRKLVRTTTGNSAHYVLDDRGHVLDVLPGLYAPSVFRRELAASLALAGQVRGMTDAERIRATVAYHRAAFAQTERAWQRASEMVPGVELRPAARGFETGIEAAQALTMGKASIEVPDLQRIGLLHGLDLSDDDAAWSAIGQHAWNLEPAAVLDATSRALVTRLHNAGPPDQRATADALASVLGRLAGHILADTAQNQFRLRQQIHRRIANRGETEFAALNAWIYDAVFATPRSDPWLGLLPRHDFTGLPGDGVVMLQR